MVSMLKRRSAASLAGIAVLLALAAPAPAVAGDGMPQAVVPFTAPKSLCADCHMATATARSRAHVLDWERSVHARRNVGCDACHGGEPATMDPMKAHLTILDNEDPKSPIYRANLPATCGKCHPRSTERFKESKHYAILMSTPNARVPTCSTCHGDIGGSLPDPEQVRTICAQCHGVGTPAGHPEYAAGAKVLMMQYAAARMMLDEVANFIPLIPDPVLRTSFETDETRARLGLTAVAEADHTLDYDEIEEKITVAFERVVSLIRRVMSSMPRPLTKG